jgi:peptidoglycan/LPS O-acetylase OafA/YrhL
VSVIPTWQYVFFVQNFGMNNAQAYGTSWLNVTWSLAVEEQFYLLFPLAVRFLSRRWLVVLLLGALLFAPLFRAVSWTVQNSDWLLYTSLPGRADALSTGALIAIAWQDKAVRSWIVAKRSTIAWCILLVLPGLASLAWAKPGSALWGEYGHSYLNVLYGLVLMAVLAYRDAPVLAPLRSKPALFVSRLSFTVYLVHPIALILTKAILRVGPDASLRLAVAVLSALFATLLYAFLFYRLVEGPCISLGHRFLYKRDTGNGENDLAETAAANVAAT